MTLEMFPVGGREGGSSGTQLWVAAPSGFALSASVFAPGQVPMDPWKRLIQEGVLRPEVRRYLFYSSRGFQIAMAVVRALGVLLCLGSDTFLLVFLGNASSQHSCSWRAGPSLHPRAGSATRAGCPCLGDSTYSRLGS